MVSAWCECEVLMSAAQGATLGSQPWAECLCP